jgi:hypothetical protein
MFIAILCCPPADKHVTFQTDWRTIRYVNDVETKTGFRVGLVAASESSKDLPNPDEVLLLL